MDQRIEVLCRLGEEHRVERLLLSQCGTTQMTRMISKPTGTAATVAYVEYKYSHTVGPTDVYYVALVLGLLTIAYNNACIQYEYRWW